MCKYCEQSEKGLFKPMAVNDIGFKIPLVEITHMDDSDTKVLQVNFDESEPLQIAINYCPICGARLSPPSPMLLEDMSDNPTGIGCYNVPIGKDKNGNDRIVAIPNPQNNYALFCLQIKRLAVGEFYDLGMPWCIQRAWVLLKDRIPNMKFDYNADRGLLMIKDTYCCIATDESLFLPMVTAQNTVYFNTPTSWKYVTDAHFTSMEFILNKIAEGIIKIPTLPDSIAHPATKKD